MPLAMPGSRPGAGVHTALVVGARGVIGGTLAEHLARLPGWDVLGLLSVPA